MIKKNNLINQGVLFRLKNICLSNECILRSLGMFGHFRIFPGTQLIPCMFPSFPSFSRFSRCFPLRTSCLTVVPFHVPVISGYFRFGPTISELFPLMVLSWLRCSTVSLFSNFPFSSLRPSHLEIDPCHVPVISGAFRFGPTISHLFRFMFLSFPDFPISYASAVSQLIPFVFLPFPDFPDFPDFFRTPVSQLFRFTFLSFPNFSDLIRIGPAVTKRSLSCSCHFQIFPNFSDFFRIGPAVT